MYGLDNQSGVNAMPALAPVKSPTPLWFTEGGSGLAPSYPGQDWFNMVQAEMLGVLTAGGVKPEKGKLNQLAEAISAIMGNYGYSKVESHLKFQPIGNYAPQGNYADGNTFKKNIENSSMTSPAGKYSLIIDNDGKLFTWDGANATFSVSSTGELLVGNVPYSRLINVPMVQTLGNSDSLFVSQKVVTDAVNGRQPIGNYADGSIFKRGVEHASMTSPNNKHSVIIDNDGKLFVWDGNNASVSFSAAGVMEVGSVPYARVTGAPANIGVGQSWSNMTSSRSAGVTYTNDTGKPIQLCVYYGADRNSNYGASIIISGIEMGGGMGGFNCIIPAGGTYRLNVSGSASLTGWLELR